MSTTEDKVADHLLDYAAVASEHGDTMLADLLTAEANALRDGSLAAILKRATDAAREAKILHAVNVETLDALRESSRSNHAARKDRERAQAKAEELVTDAWLREGYNKGGKAA